VIVRRRALVLAACAGILVAPLGASAQQAASVPRVGVTVAGFPPNAYVESLRRGLADLGWIEGKNILIEYRYAEGRNDRWPQMMADLVGLKVDLIVAGGGEPAVSAAKQLTSTIPIVMPATYDPVAAGLVSSLARPGGNITGHAQADAETTVKRMEFLKALRPKAQRVAVLGQRGMYAPAHTDAIEAAARSLGLQLQRLTASRVEALDGAFGAFKDAGAEGLIVLASGVFTAHRKRVVDLAAQHRLVAVYEHRDFVDAGGLMSYGPSFEELWRGAARYVDNILKGAAPADLPIEQPTKFELAINLKTARSLQITVPQALFVRADRIVE
jgi:putative ABC transport system substrate-binding protein